MGSVSDALKLMVRHGYLQLILHYTLSTTTVIIALKWLMRLVKWDNTPVLNLPTFPFLETVVPVPKKATKKEVLFSVPAYS